MRGLISIYLDLLRFLAALGVFLWHAGSLASLPGVLPVIYFNHTLVILFFVISGFVIAASAARPDRTLVNYAADRVTRLSVVVIPALALTYLLGIAGLMVSPELYANINPHWQGLRFLANLLYCQQLWGLCVNPFNNNPFWSLGYEFWYYVLFGIWIFVRSKTVKFGLILTVSLLVGPKILLLFPAWVVGALAFHAGKSWKWSNAASWLSFGISGLAMLAVLFYGREMGLENGRAGQAPWYYSSNFMGDNVFAVIVALNFLGCALLGKHLKTDFDSWRLVRVIRWLAGHTFSLYLYHVPIIVGIRAVTKYDPRNPYAVWGAVALTLVIIAGLAKVTEEKYPKLRILSRQYLAKMTGRLPIAKIS